MDPELRVSVSPLDSQNSTRGATDAQQREFQPAYREEHAAQQGKDSLGGWAREALPDFRKVWEVRDFQLF